MRKIILLVSIVGVVLLPSISQAKGQCQSGWIDTHVHYGNSEFIEDALMRMNKHDVNCALLLNMDLNSEHPKKSYKKLKSFLQKHPKRFYPFFSNKGIKATDNRVSKLKTALGKHGDTFYGMGESAFYSSEFSDISLTSTMWQKIFNYAGKNNFVLMIHLRPGQAEELDTMLTNYPNTTVLLHGAEVYESIDSLLTEHDNLMYTLDTSILLWGSAGNLMYPDSGGNAIDFIAAFDEAEDTLLSEAQDKWYSIIEAHPNKVMWGTDISENWHINRRVYRRLLRFSEDFAAPLENKLEKKYLRLNAKNFLGSNGVVIDN